MNYSVQRRHGMMDRGQKRQHEENQKKGNIEEGGGGGQVENEEVK